MKAFNKVLGKFTSWFNIIGTAILPILMFVMLTDIFGRTLFNKPLPGGYEIVQNALTLITFTQMAHCLRVDRHIRATILLDILPEKVQAALNLFAEIAGFLIIAFVVYSVWPEMLRNIAIRSFDQGSIRVPTWPVTIVVVAGSILMGVQYLVNIINHILALFGKDILAGEEASA